MFKRLILTALVLGVSLVLFVGAKKKIKEESIWLSTQLRRSKMEVNPVVPDSGITTGHLILYGHYVPPPYKVELRDTEVYINKVRVWPGLKTPDMRIEDSLLYPKNWKEKSEKAKEIFLREIEKDGDTLKATKIAAESLKVLCGWDSVKVKKSVEYTSFLGNHQCTRDIYIRLGEKRRDKILPPRKDLIFTPQERAQQIAKKMIEGLKEGKVIDVAWEGWGILDDSVLIKIKEIINMPISSEEKINQLWRLGLSGRYIIANYNPEEWKSIGGEK